MLLRRLLLIPVVVLALVAGALGFASPAMASDISISGTVTAADGGDVDFVRAEAWVWDEDGLAWNWSAAAEVDSGSGEYAIEELEAGTEYKIFFSSQGRLLSEFYDDVQAIEDAQIVATSGDGPVTGIDAELALGTSISGTVSASDGGAVGDVDVELYAWDGWENWRYEKSVPVDPETGAYVIDGVESNVEYKVYFSSRGRLLSEFYDDAESLWGARNVTVAEGGTTGVDAELAVGGSIGGTLSVPTGVGDTYVQVTAYRWQEEWESWSWENYAWLDGNGPYQVQGLRAGEYLLEFGGSEQVAREYYDDAFTQDTATTVAVSLGESITGIDADLVRAASIAGKVTVPSGVAATQVEVSVFRDGTGTALTSGRPASNGNYQASGLPDGNYTLRFQHLDRSVATQYYAGKPTRHSGDRVELAAGEAKTGINVTLALGASVTGRVTTADAGYYGGEVRLWARSSTAGPWELVDTEWTDGDGRYRFANVPDGQYTVEARSDGPYAGQFWESADTLADAGSFTIAGASRTGVNLVLSHGASIAGEVTDAGGAHVYSRVRAYRFDAQTQQWEAAAEGYTDDMDEYGTYRLSGLAPGTYRVGFLPQSGTYLSQYYNGKDTLQDADDIVVARRAAIADVDAVLADNPARGGISGTVTVPAGAQANEVAVQVFRADEPDPVREVYPDNDTGRYALRGLQPGTYTVKFFGGWEGLLSEYFDDVTRATDATPVVVTAGGTRQGVDADLDPDPAFGTISGTMRSESGGAVEGYVRLWKLDPDFGDWDTYRWQDVAPDGSWSSRSLLPGEYAVEFKTYTPEYVDEFYDNAGSIETADRLTLVEGQTISNIDGRLAVDETVGTIAGTVATVKGAPQDVWVSVFEAHGGGWDETRWEPVNPTTGAYAVTGLKAGTYKVRFNDESGDLVSEYYNDKATLAAADVVTVSQLQTTRVDAELACLRNCGTSVITPGAVTLSGTPTVGSELLVGTGAWSPSPVELSYQWYRTRGNVETIIVGANRPSYTVTSADVGHTLHAVVTGTRSGFGTVSQASSVSAPVTASTPGPEPTPPAPSTAAPTRPAPTTAAPTRPAPTTAAPTRPAPTTAAPVPPAPKPKASAPAGTPTVRGTGRVGQVQRVTPRAPAGTKTSIRWLRNGSAIAKATGTSYRLKPADRGRRITVRVTYVKTGHTNVVKNVVSVAKVAAAVPKISVAAKGAKKSATFTIRVKAAGVSPTGKVTIKLGARKLKTVTLRNGKATIKVKRLKKGKKSYAIVYSGGNGVAGKTVKKSVKVS